MTLRELKAGQKFSYTGPGGSALKYRVYSKRGDTIIYYQMDKTGGFDMKTRKEMDLGRMDYEEVELIGLP